MCHTYCEYLHIYILKFRAIFLVIYILVKTADNVSESLSIYLLTLTMPNF